MQEFQHKKRTRRFLYSFPVIIILVFLLLVLVRGVCGAWEKREYAREKAEEVAVQIDLLKEREAELKAKISRLESEQGKEEELREKFLVGKEGEGVVFIVDPPVSTTTNEESAESGFWSGFLDWFR